MTLRGRRAASVGAAAVALVSFSAVGLVISQSGQEAALATADPTVEPPLLPGTRPTATPPEVREPALGEIPEVRSASPVPMPLDRYLTSMSDIKLIDQAQDVAAATCMRSLGFTEWTTSTISTWRPEDYREYDKFEYLDPKAVAQSGYPRPPALEAAPLGAQPKREPTIEERKAFQGVATRTAAGRAIPEGGCMREADRNVYGKAAALPADPRALAVGSRSRAIGDSRVQAALTAWRACMQDVGMTAYQHPVTSWNDPRWQSRPAGTPASAEERKVAAADANCQVKVNMVGTYKTVRAAYEQQLLDENKAAIEESIRIFDGWVGNAKAILKAG